MTVTRRNKTSTQGKEPRDSSRGSSPRIRSVKFNVVMNAILISSRFIFPLVTVPYVSRVLLAHGTGLVAFAQSIVSYFSLVALLGIPAYGVRTCASVRDNREELSQTVQEIMTILLATTTVAYAVYLVAVFTVPQMASDKALFLISGISIWLSSMGVEWFYQAIEQYGYITIRNIAVKIISIALMFAFVHVAQDYRIYACITVIAGYGSNVLNMFRLRTFVDFSLNRKMHLRKHFKAMGPFVVINVLEGLLSQADLVILGFLGSPSMVGLYQLVAKTKSVELSAVNAGSGVMLPRLSYYNGNRDAPKYVTLLTKNLNFVTIVALAAISVFTLTTTPIVLILGGNDFLGSAAPLQIASASILFAAYSTLLSQHLIASGKENYYAIACVVALIAMIAFGFTFIPMLGVSGAALAMTLCGLTQTLLLIGFSWKTALQLLHRSELGRIVVSAALAYAVGAIASQLARPNGIIFELLVPGLSFAAVYGLMLVVTKEYFVTMFVRSLATRILHR